MPPPYDITLAVFCVITAIAGMFTNGFLIFTVANNPTLRQKDYIRFILNRTIADFVNCWVLGILEPAGILDNRFPLVCIVAGFLEMFILSTSIYQEPVLACNRFVSMFYRHHHKKIYTPRNVHLMCGIVWILGFCSALPHLAVGSLGRAAGSTCTVNVSKDTFLVTFASNYVPMFAGMAAVGFFNGKIYCYLKQHQNQSMTNNQRTRLQSQREMLHFLMMAAFLPLLFETPALMVFWIQSFIYLSEWIKVGSLLIFNMPFAVNPLISLFMVQPLRKEAKRNLNRILGKHAMVEPQGPIIEGPGTTVGTSTANTRH